MPTASHTHITRQRFILRERCMIAAHPLDTLDKTFLRFLWRLKSTVEIREVSGQSRSA
jgi:hypothetical protein